MTVIDFKVHNTNKGIIREWSGLQPDALAVDEFGNEFKPIETYNWHGVEGNGISHSGPDIGKTKIEPGKVYRCSIYLEKAPATTKMLTLYLNINGKPFTFKGSIPWKTVVPQPEDRPANPFP